MSTETVDIDKTNQEHSAIPVEPVVVEVPKEKTTDEKRDEYRAAVQAKRERYEKVRKIVSGTSEKKYVVSIGDRTEAYVSKKELRAALNDENQFTNAEITELGIEFKHVKLTKRKIAKADKPKEAKKEKKEKAKK